VLGASKGEEKSMPNDIRDLPAGSNDGLYRFLGGSPLAVLFRLVLLSIVGRQLHFHVPGTDTERAATYRRPGIDSKIRA